MKLKTIRSSGFSLIEMLVIVAIILLLARLLLPSLAQARVIALRAQCASNVHQLTLAWRQFSLDNDGALISGATGGGWIDSNTYGNSIAAIQKGTMWPYLNSLGVYHCPADESIPLHYNSYVVNCWLNGEWGWLNSITNYSSIKRPAETFVFTEENDPRGYDMGAFVVPASPTTYFVDWPSGAFHFDGSTMSFADGHVEYWKWSQEVLDLNTAGCCFYYTPVTPQGIADLQRLQAVTNPQ